jgi:S1-C subfamily serine protease
MSLTRLVLLGAVATLLVACGAPRPLAEAQILERARAVTVTVEVDPGARVEVRPNPSTGAPELVPVPAAAQLAGGLVVGDGLVLTAAHLVDGAAAVAVRLPAAESPLPATVIGVSACDDLALLQVDPAALEAPRLAAAADLELGASVLTVGEAPVGAWAASPILSPGVITWRSPERGELAAGSLLLTSATLPPGYVSAPLLSGSGEVVGLLM